MDVQVNWLAVVLAFVASMVVGSIWYAKPVFGNTWSKLVKMDDKKMKMGASGAYAKMIPLGFIEAFVLAHVTYLSAHFYTSYTWFGAAISTAFWVWLGFQLTALLVHDVFEQRPTKLSLINAGNQLATLLAMGIVIGLLKPSGVA